MKTAKASNEAVGKCVSRQLGVQVRRDAQGRWHIVLAEEARPNGARQHSQLATEESRRGATGSLVIPLGEASADDRTLTQFTVGPAIGDVTPDDRYAWMATELSSPAGRKRAARKTGIVNLQWLDRVQPPKASPRLAVVVEHYVAKPGLSHDETVRARKQWGEFRQATGARTLRQISHTAVAKYEATMQTTGLAPKSIRHRYGRVRTIISYAMRRGVDAKECRSALDVVAMLEAPAATPLSPHPIAVADFWKIHAAAMANGDRQFAAMMLMAANCCMYSGEVSALRWSEVDLSAGEVVTIRPKTGVARVAILWPETVSAAKALPQTDENMFIFESGRSYTTSRVCNRFAVYREAANLQTTVKFGDIRDAAYTHACRAVTLDKAKILAGHRLSGATDHYVQRNPGFVTEACNAIRVAMEVEKNIRALRAVGRSGKRRFIP